MLKGLKAMAYALQSMLKIRGMREDRAQTELAGARLARAKAERELEEKSTERMKFEETKETRRDKIFETVIGRVVSMDELDRARSAVTAIDEQGVLLAEAENRAEHLLEQRDEETEAARARFATALRNKAKIDQHKAVWEEKERKMQEMLADAEMEEFTGKGPMGTSEDDDSLD